MFPGELGSLGYLFVWRVGLGFGKTLSGSYLLPSSDIVFIWKSKMLGFCLTPAFTQFIISPSRTNPKGVSVLSHLVPCVFSPRYGSFSLWMQLLLGLAVDQKTGKSRVSPFTHLFQMTSSPATDTQKAVCIVATGASPPQGSTLRGRLLFSTLL